VARWLRNTAYPWPLVRARPPLPATPLRCWRGAAEETFADLSVAAIADVVAVAGTADALLAPAGDKEYYDVYFQVAPKPASACCAQGAEARVCVEGGCPGRLPE